jgi:hypothetical protein
MKPPLKHGRQEQEGAIAILAAIVLIALGGMIALSLNMGHKASARTQLQAAYDGGSLAGALSLDGTTAGITRANSAGLRIAELHSLDRFEVALNSSDVVPGYWNSSTKTFFAFGQTVTIGDSPLFLDQALTPQYFNAIKVAGGADGLSGHNYSLDVILGGFFGASVNLKVTSDAVAVGGGPCSVTGCTLPLAVPTWALLDATGATACGTVMTLDINPGHGKQAAFADVTQPGHQPTPNIIKDQNAAVAHCAATPDSPDVTTAVGDDIQLSQGNFMNNAVEKSFDDLACAAAAPYAGCPRYQIPVVNIDQNTPMNQDHLVVGFVRVVFLGADGPGATTAVHIYIDCTGTSTGPTGCASFGFNTKKVRLVQ